MAITTLLQRRRAFIRSAEDRAVSCLICYEGACLYKISNNISRKNNYEQILTILNDCLQGKASYISIIFSGTIVRKPYV